MATILDRIVEHKKLEVERRKGLSPLSALKSMELYGRTTNSLCEALKKSDNYGIIAEFKRKSPSQDDINLAADPEEIISGYTRAGATGISCITDINFFGSQANDIDRARTATDLPLLRKDFIVDPYQLHESRAMGADVILLIASVLSANQLDELAREACEIGLNVLCEVHDEADVAKLSSEVDIVGVNNRDLRDFSVSITRSLELAEILPPSLLRISESGIDDPQSVVRLKRAGYQGFLVGTHFMRQPDPGVALANFIAKTREIDDLYEGAIV